MKRKVRFSYLGFIALMMIALFVWKSPARFFADSELQNKKHNVVFPNYEATIQKKDGDTYVVNNPDSILVLVNKQRRLPDAYTPADLVIPKVRFAYTGDKEKMKMRKEAAGALEKLFAKAQQQNVNLFAVSAYRSYERQKALHTMYKQTEGEAVAVASSAVPGTSEHQTGLAIDVSSQSAQFQLEAVFGETKEGKWLMQHGHEYGFVIRYPKGKEKVTGYTYEPWHIRYVGIPYATYLYKHGLTLEEAMPSK
ncbi:D-alanyl-D-alanine carboxypeptidase family protein [Microbacteriaceae bacterium 4G12]